MSMMMMMMIRRIGTKSGVIAGFAAIGFRFSSLLSSRPGIFTNDFVHGDGASIGISFSLHRLHSAAANPSQVTGYPWLDDYKKEILDDFVSVREFSSDENLQLSDKDVDHESQIVTDQNPEGKYGALEKYSNDLTEVARRGKLDPVIGRDDEILQCIHILCKRTKNNPVIIGEPGVGKTTIVKGLAQRIVFGDVPEPLKNLKLISLDMGLLLAGARYREDFEDWLQAVLMEVIASNGQIVLFVDQIHTLLGGAGANGGAMDDGNVLKRMLGRGQLQCIIATTLNEYTKYIEKDPSLENRFQQVFCDQLCIEDAISILYGLREGYEQHHGVKISNGALVSAAVLADRYITKRFLPDKAIDLVDESAAKLKMEITFKPTKLEEIDRVVRRLEMEKLYLKKDAGKASEERLAKLESDLERLKEKQKKFNKQWELEKIVLSIKKEIDRVNQDAVGKGTLINLQRHLEEAERNLWEYCQQSGKSCMLLREKVTDIDIAETVSKWTGIPLSNLQESDREKLVSLEHALRKRVVGQDMAVKVVADAIRRSKLGVGLSDPNKPIASFMFTGPNGVGKTELAKALASYLFNTKNALVRIDMSQYMDKHAVSRLVGGLTETVTRMPYSVVLFDEMEKAHHHVFNILLKLLDDGRITDSQGRTLDFRKSIIIMTSNFIPRMLYDTKDTVYYDLVELGRLTFWPQLINHIDEHIVFQPFEIRDIVEIQLNFIKDRLKQKKIDLGYTKEAMNILGKFGAKAVKKVIQEVVENEISLGILQGDFNQDDTLIVDSCPSAKGGVHIRKVDSRSGM